jgi:hypothetical protein
MSVFADAKKEKTQKSSIASRLAHAIWSVAKTVAPNQVNTLTDNMAPPVVVNEVETTLYLDDSPSMREQTDWFSFTSRLDQGKSVLSWLAPMLLRGPCRVLKFSNQATVLKPREEKGSLSSSFSQIDASWNGMGNGTYLWHMIQDDVTKRYRPGTGKLRLVVVTDGDDNLSPHEYRGMRGMDPMMRNLQTAGYDIEWHIIVIGGETGLERYKALAGATGGSFLSIPKEFDETDSDALAFMDAIVEGSSSVHHDNDHGRRERQKRYELAAREGKVDKVDWYKKLPPPEKK